MQGRGWGHGLQQLPDLPLRQRFGRGRWRFEAFQVLQVWVFQAMRLLQPVGPAAQRGKLAVEAGFGGPSAGFIRPQAVGQIGLHIAGGEGVIGLGIQGGAAEVLLQKGQNTREIALISGHGVRAVAFGGGEPR